MEATAPAGGTERRTVTFATDGLSARDETLFKSFVRLLAHRTEHAWKPASGPADVLVVAQGGGARRNAVARCTLVLGASPGGEPHFARFPFHADDLEAALNKAAASLAARNSGEGSITYAGGLVRLLRWPPPRLLASTQRIRLATLLGTQPLPLSALAARSGCEILACTEFLSELAREGLVTMLRNPPPGSAPVRMRAVDPRLLARIRQRLGRAAASA